MSDSQAPVDPVEELAPVSCVDDVAARPEAYHPTAESLLAQILAVLQKAFP